MAPGPQPVQTFRPREPELVADSLRVVVLLAADRVAAPADDDVGPHPRPQHARVAQDAIDGVGDALRLLQVDAAVLVDLAVDVQDVAQHREQVLLDAADHAAIDEGPGRGVAQFELHAPGLCARCGSRSRRSARRSCARRRSRRRRSTRRASSGDRSGRARPRDVSSRRSTSCCDRFSRLPVGVTRASTETGSSAPATETSTRRITVGSR